MGGGVLDSDIATAKNAMQSKFWGQFYVGRYGGSKIKSTGSLTFTAGSGPRPHQAIATVAANAGVSLLAESLAKELAPVRVNVVSPYYTDTPMWEGMAADSRQDLFERVAKQLPIGFIAKAEDVAPTYLHVLQSTYLTGITIPVNGGALLQTIA
jgi:NAD(P)-dependent dehydrogenase (short-subunit alcohol dehydrogenase family)